MARWYVRLSANDYGLKYQLDRTHQNAEDQSRLPVLEEIEEHSSPRHVLLFDAFPEPPLTASKIAHMTRKTPAPSRLYSVFQAGIVGSLRGDDDFRPYMQRASELNICHGFITWEDCVVVSVADCAEARTTIHTDPRGVVVINNFARSNL